MIFDDLTLLFDRNKKDPVFRLYRKILKVEDDDYTQAFFNNYLVFESMMRYLKRHKTDIKGLLTYSDEQLAYVTNPSPAKTKMIACPGSGKTRCILSRIHFMITHKMCHKDEVFAITFNRFASQEFQKRLKQLFPGDNIFNTANFSTIDSLAKSILILVKSHKSENVEILSIAFRNFLQETPASQLQNLGKLGKMKHLFIDEAQDLNEIQFDILKLLQEKLNTNIHLIGDPNQNIYQFRGSSDQYLLNFNATQFTLTINFRSTKYIIDFFSLLRPINTGEIKAVKAQGSKVKIINKSDQEIHRLLIAYIKNYKRDYSDIAIICATRGIKTDRGIGLSVIFNLLKMHNIPFVQGYEEASTNDERQRRAISVKGSVNLLTLHGVKGLEFSTVFFLDCYQQLFNIKPTEKDHRIHQYLMYVGCSRAIDELYLCANLEANGGFMNHWLGQTNPLTYETTGFKLPRLEYREETRQQIYSITELINNLSTEQLNTIIDLIDYNEEHDLLTTKMYEDFRNIDRKTDESLFGILTEELYYLQYSLLLKEIPRQIKLIEIILKNELIVIKDDYTFNYLKKQILQNRMSWDSYDLMKHQMPLDIQRAISKLFSRDRELYQNIICQNQFSELINLHLPDIKKAYEAYLAPKEYKWDYNEILKDFFFLVVVIYAYEINHYFYITNHGIDKEYLLENGKEMFHSMHFHAKQEIKNGVKIIPKCNLKYKPLMMTGEIDFLELDKNNNLTICEIKTVKEINFKHILQVYLYHFCFYVKKTKPKKIRKIYEAKVKILNFLSGLEHQMVIKINTKNLFKLLNTLADAGDLKWNNLNIVYDLETTGRIERIPIPGFQKPQLGPRQAVYKKGNEWILETYPEIIEIAMKDYQSQMVIYTQLVKSSGLLPSVITEITGITSDLLERKGILQAEFKDNFIHVMKRFAKNKFLAHNGKAFDDKIMNFYKLLPEPSEFIDTLSLIPIHYDDKFDAKNLSAMYEQLFGEKFKAHRAMADVNALIRIMWFMKINI